MCTDVEHLSTLRRGLFSSCSPLTLSFLSLSFFEGSLPSLSQLLSGVSETLPCLLAFPCFLSALSLTGLQPGVQLTVMGTKDMLSSFKVCHTHKHTVCYTAFQNSLMSLKSHEYLQTKQFGGLYLLPSIDTSFWKLLVVFTLNKIGYQWIFWISGLKIDFMWPDLCWVYSHSRNLDDVLSEAWYLEESSSIALPVTTSLDRVQTT